MNEQTESLLIAKNISPTAMRIVVLEYLQRQTVAVSLQDLERAFQRAERTTLYRTLKTFEEKGLVHGITDGTDATKYALCVAACKEGSHADLHLHFYCYSCKQTYCLPRHQVPEVSVPETFQLKELDLIAKGLCGKCGTNNAIQLHGSAG